MISPPSFVAGEDRLHRREADHVDEIFEVLGVRALRRPGEAVVAADQHANAAAMHLAAGLDSMFEFALIAHRDRRARLDAVFASVARGVDEPGEPGRDEVPVLGRFEHVERFFVGERGVIDDANSVTNALLDRAGGAGVSGKRLVAELGFAHRHLHLLLRHRRFLGAHAGDLFAGEIELDGVDAILDEHPHRAAHLLRSGDDEAEIETLMGDVGGRGIAQASDRRDFRSGREITRARESCRC